MGFKSRLSTLWAPPQLNPVTKKARSIPLLNPLDRHGRVFFFSWMGFMIAFWAWYTFPPLLTVTIREDLHLTKTQVANSNIVSLSATLLIRLISGPLCDAIGPRKVFALVLLLGSIPVGLAPLIHNAAGLYTIRFFIGILGASFVPCQVWCTLWFDRNVVGTANGLAGGWGNAGGGVTYFIMPAVFDSLVGKGLTPGKAWRVTFVVPLVCLVVCGLGLLVLCEDCPTGRWADRYKAIEANLAFAASDSTDSSTDTDKIVPVPGSITSRPPSPSRPSNSDTSPEKKQSPPSSPSLPPTQAMSSPSSEIPLPPSLHTAIPILLSPQCLFHVLTYACSFGGELAINAVLSSYYLSLFPTKLTQTTASNYAAIFGFLNFLTRPLGGVIADLLYNLAPARYKLWSKKLWITTCGVLTGSLLILIGLYKSPSLAVTIALVCVMAFFHEAGNGANFALLPHVFPQANGLLSGVTGAGGNLGGVVFAIVLRFMDGGTNYSKGFWVIGIVHVVVNLAVCWVRPVAES